MTRGRLRPWEFEFQTPIPVKDVPRYTEVVNYLSAFMKTRYTLAKRPLIREAYGGTSTEAAIDDAHVTMLVSSKINEGADFSGFSTVRLDSLNEGRDTDGQAVVGESKTVVKDCSSTCSWTACARSLASNGTASWPTQAR